MGRVPDVSDPDTDMVARLGAHRARGLPFATVRAGDRSVRVATSASTARKLLTPHDRYVLSVHDIAPRRHSTVFGRSLFTTSGPQHAALRAELLPVLVAGDRQETYRREVRSTVARHVSAWAAEGRVDDLLGSVRSLMNEVCSSTVVGLDRGAATNAFVAQLDDFLAALTGSGAGPDGVDPVYAATEALRATLDRHVRDSTRTDTVLAGLRGRTVDRRSVVDQLLSLLVASRETTASLLVWLAVDLVRTGGDVPAGPDHRSSAERIARLYSPNLLAMRRVEDHFAVDGERFGPGDMVAYSPATGSFSADQHGRAMRGEPVDPPPGEPDVSLGFGLGSRACPGRRLAGLIAQQFAGAFAGAGDWVLRQPERIADPMLFPLRLPRRPLRLLLREHAA